MYDRFTHKSRIGRGKIPRGLREEIYRRDHYTCQFCGSLPPREDLTIDHLVPLDRRGLDEKINYVTSCRKCNEQKSNMPLRDFAKSLSIEIEKLPVHGDPIIDNEDLPLEIRLIRKRVFDRFRKRKSGIRGRSAQKKIEKSFRRELWQSDVGAGIRSGSPLLPGHVRAALPQIEVIAKNDREVRLLIELAKSAKTRNLIGSVIKAGDDVEKKVRSIEKRTNDDALRKRVLDALKRFEKMRC